MFSVWRNIFLTYNCACDWGILWQSPAAVSSKRGGIFQMLTAIITRENGTKAKISESLLS